MFPKKLSLILNIFVFLVLFCVMGAWFYNAARLNLDAYNSIWIYDAEDVISINQIVWNTSQGKIFRHNILAIDGDYIPEDVILTHGSANVLGSHPAFLYVFIALFYFVLSHFASYIILGALFMSLSGLGLYLVARTMLTEKRILPLFVFLIYMCYYPFVNNSHYFHLEEFSIAFIFFAYYFYLKERLKPLLIFALLAVFCREDNTLIFMLLGVVSYFFPEKKKLSLPLTLFGVSSFFIVKLLIPNLLYTYYDAIQRNYSYLGETGPEMLKNIFFNPRLILNNVLREDRVLVFKSIFSPVFYLPFLSPVLFIPGLVILAEIMLTSVTVLGVLDVYPWYMCSLMPFVFIALTGTIEKIYRIDKILKKYFPPFFSLKGIHIFTKIASFYLICFLCFHIYAINSRLSKMDYGRLREHFAIRRYWHRDTFGALSGIIKNTKLSVTCHYLLTPILSLRDYIIPIRYLTESLVDKGAFDIIALYPGNGHLDSGYQFNFVEESPLYKRIYYTPHIRIFAKDNIHIDTWKFDLISKIRDSSLAYNYVISDFTDYSSILENSGAIGAEELVKNVYQNSKLFYAVLEPAKKISQFLEDDNKLTYYLSDKPLETGYTYILAFAAKSDEGSGTVYVRGPEGNPSDTEVKIDAKLRPYMIPFKVNSPLENSNFLIQLSRSSSLTKPLLFRSPQDNREAQEPILTASLNKHTFSYNPWLKADAFNSREIKSREFLVRYLDKNPMIYFMKLLRLSIPLDLYKYRWVPDYKKGEELIAVRYSIFP